MASDCKQSRLSIDHILAQFLSRVGMQTLRTGFGVKGWDTACQCFVQESDLKMCETVFMETCQIHDSLLSVFTT